ncbi:MAG: gamma-glutamyltransferase [Candidatus Poribacteria bacterium]
MPSRKICAFLTSILLFGCLPPMVFWAEAEKRLPARGQKGMVSTSHPLASKTGIEILKRGGNAIDATVATAFVLGVVEQYSSGIGGGSLILIRLADTGEVLSVDARETAPLKSNRDMYLRDGKAVPSLSRTGILAGGVPGTVAGLALILKKYGTMSLAEIMEPSIHYAENGFKLTQRHINAIKSSRKKLEKFPESAKIYLPNGQLPETGSLLIQYDLASTLKSIARNGPNAFYHGEIANKMVKFMEKDGGLITATDLAAYQAKVRKPIHGTYRGYDIYSMPPPSSGGIHMIQILNILEDYDLSKTKRYGAEFTHLLAEAIKLAFADRAHFLGDSDFVDVPINGLISKSYANKQRSKINANQVLDLERHGNPLPYESENTTHFSVLDQDGNAVSITQTVNTSFGSGMIIEGTGIILNNEMDDFSAQPGVPNIYGLVGAEANSIAPQKRPLSSMSPTILVKDGQTFMVIGSPGGPRIITTVVQAIINVIDYGMDIQSAVDGPRIHHQWKPNKLRVEADYPIDTLTTLLNLGHQIEQKGSWSLAHGIIFEANTGIIYGGADHRNQNSLAIGW